MQQSARQAQHVFQRGIGKQHHAVATDHSHQGGQQIKGCKTIAQGGTCRAGEWGFQASYFPTRAAPCWRASSRLMLAMSLSLRARLALISATRSRYFW